MNKLIKPHSPINIKQQKTYETNAMKQQKNTNGTITNNEQTHETPQQKCITASSVSQKKKNKKNSK